MVIAITRSGYIKRLPVTAYREQRRGGIGVMGMDMKDDDYIEHLFVASTHDYILFFTSVGKVYRLKVHELPLGSRQSKGRAIVNLLPFRQDEQVRAVSRPATSRRPSTCSARRRTASSRRRGSPSTTRRSRPTGSSRSRCARATSSSPCATARPATTSCSSRARARRSASPRPTRARWGARPRACAGMLLRGDDEVIAAEIARDDSDLLVVTENGFGKRTRVSEYPRKGRGGMGVQDGQAHRGARPARRRARRPRRLPGDADLDRRHRDQDAGRGRQAARPLDAGRDRDAAARAARSSPRSRRWSTRRRREDAD